ncbi:MAG: EscU/YscU/HrcU family type III secretion system export apparatus switch protein [Myxococcaceae bacterium]|nr:EscU/YscU/HrcU family type III secretion system export apparatus switch protein [Myxococcaceae bacterium]
MSEKTHEPSEQKLRQARDDGNIPKSKLLSAAAVTLGGMIGTAAFAPQSAATLMAWTQRLLSLDPRAPELELLEAVSVLGRCLAPSLIGALFGAVAAGLPMAGIQFNLKLVEPKLENVNPIEGFQKLFKVRQLVDLGKSLVVAGVMVFLVWSATKEAAPSVMRAVHHDALTAFRVVLAAFLPAVVRASVVLIVLGLADYALARLRHTKDLMMSHDEVKQEHKNSEGDPHTKGERKHLMKQLAMGGPARGVQKATAVVVNPTHIAVAIRYDESECDAPYIVARGREEDALAMRKEAKKLGIPVVRDVPLARSLIHYDVGEEVPEELYQAAAAVLRVALESTGENGSMSTDGAQALVKEAP